MNNETIAPIKDPNVVLEAINKIIKKREDVYVHAPQKPNIKVEIVIERCRNKYCPFDHIMVNITADYMLGEELLDICRYLKKNKLPFCYMENTFKIILS